MSENVLRLLLGRGSPRAVRTTSGQSAVTMAMHRMPIPQVDIVRLFIEAGVQPDLQPRHIRDIAARISVPNVLSSYFADNISPLAAAVRPPLVTQVD